MMHKYIDIEQLEDVVTGLNSKGWGITRNDFKLIDRVLFEFPAADIEPRWIPCSERYPDMDERVLVYTVAHDYHVWDCMSNRADNYFWEDEVGLYRDKYEADLWMPLPEPYKEGEQNE